MAFDEEAHKAIELAKSSLPEGAALEIGPLMGALYHATSVRNGLDVLDTYLQAPRQRRKVEKVPIAESLRPILSPFVHGERPVGARELFAALAFAPTGAGGSGGRGCCAIVGPGRQLFLVLRTRGYEQY